MKDNNVINIAGLIYRFINIKSDIFSEIKEKWGEFYGVNFNTKLREYIITKDFPNIWIFKTFLKKRLLRDLIKYNMLLVHSAAFLYKGNAFLFLGETGKGKSTLIKKVKNRAVVLCDETNIIDVENMLVYSTPFWGDVPQITNMRAPLSRVFILEKLDKNVVKILDKKNATLQTLKTVLCDTASRKLKIFELVLKLVKSVKFYIFLYKINSNLFEILKKL